MFINKVFIIDTNKWSDRFANEMGKFITQSSRGGSPTNTPSYGNNGYGFTAPLTDEGYKAAKQHHIDYIVTNDLNKVNETLEFYKNTRADVTYYLSEKQRIEEKIDALKEMDKLTFLPYPTQQSVIIDIRLADENIPNLMEDYQNRAIQYCKDNDIELVGFRYVEETPSKVDKPAVAHSDRTDLKVTVKSYKGRLVVETLQQDEKIDADYQGAEGGVIGCNLRNLKRLGISAEAFEIMQSVRRGNDCIGDLCGDKNSFSWIGGGTAILGPKIVGSRTYKPVSSFIEIDNKISNDIIKLIDDSEKIKDIDFKDIKFDLWVEFTKKTDEANYNVNIIVQEAHFYDDKINIINAPEKSITIDKEYTDIRPTKEDKRLLADLLFHNILGEEKRIEKAPKVLAEGEIEDPFDKTMREFEEMQERWWNHEVRHGYSHVITYDVIWDYVNSFFDLGFDNNIMNPSERYFRLSMKGTISELAEKLLQFKLKK